MIKRRAEAVGLPYSTCCHTFRATGITTYLQNGGTLEHAQTIANHESPRTTKLYDRTREELSSRKSRESKSDVAVQVERILGSEFHSDRSAYASMAYRLDIIAVGINYKSPAIVAMFHRNR